MSPFLTSLITLVGGVVGLLLVAGLIARNYKKAAPNKALVFFGRRNRIGAGKLVGAKIITSGGKFKWPIVEDVAELDLSTFQMQVDLRDIPNKDGVLVNVNAVATCKIKSDEVSLNAAAERFLGKSRQEIETLIRENLEGQLRAVIGTLTVEDVITNRDVLNNKVRPKQSANLRLSVSASTFSTSSRSRTLGVTSKPWARRERPKSSVTQTSVQPKPSVTPRSSQLQPRKTATSLRPRTLP